MNDLRSPDVQDAVPDLDRWVRLCALLDDDGATAAAVALALTDPAAYREQRDAELGLRGLTADESVQPWQALLTALDESGVLAYLERDDPGDVLVDALAPLARVRACGVDLRDVCDADDPAEAIRCAQAALAGVGLALVGLPEPDDDEAVPLVVVTRSTHAEVMALLAIVGQRPLDLVP